MKIQFLGHAAFYVETSQMRALIDPFYSTEAFEPIFSIKDITHIFITHGHSDHLGDAVSIAKETNALVISNYEICHYLKSLGLNCHPMHIGGRTDFSFGRVKMTPALHGSAIETPEGLIYGGNPGGFLIEAEGKKLYHAGDTGLTMDMQLLAPEKIDVALLPIGGNFTMDVQDAIRAVDFIQPKVAIPMHYNTFPIINAPHQDFAAGVTSALIKVLEIGQVYDF